ncbi:MAG: MerR family transcriptional regulator [Litorimonas sp.]
MRMKTTRAFRTISEAGDELGLQPHVLRFWESKFSDITPIKRGGGRRFYRPEDIEFLRGIKTLLHDEKHPIKDVQKLIAKSGANRIIELGRSVEEASRERDLTDMTFVPDRIEKPGVDVASPVTSPPPSAPAPVIKRAPVQTPTPEPDPIPAPKPKDLSGLEDALGRLQALKGQWDAFDASN